MAKQKVRILADATIDLPPEWVEKYNIGILPTQIMLPDREKPYRNYIDITAEEFYEKLLVADEVPTTAVPRQGDIYRVYEESLQAFESLIVLAHSSKISGSYNSAKKVAEMFPGKDITVVDTQTITIMEGLLVYEGAKMAQLGGSKEEILARITELIPHTHGVAILKTLEYLRKGGRISVAKQVLGNLAKLKPIIAVENGLVKNIGKVKGFENGVALLKNAIPKIVEGRKTETIAILHALMPEEAATLKEHVLAQKDSPQEVEIFLIGPVLGTHMGPYCLGLGWIGTWDERWFK